MQRNLLISGRISKPVTPHHKVKVGNVTLKLLPKGRVGNARPRDRVGSVILSHKDRAGSVGFKMTGSIYRLEVKTFFGEIGDGWSCSGDEGGGGGGGVCF